MKCLYGNIYDRHKEFKRCSQILDTNTLPQLLSQCIACYLTIYYVEKNPFSELNCFLLN